MKLSFTLFLGFATSAFGRLNEPVGYGNSTVEDQVSADVFGVQRRELGTTISLTKQLSKSACSFGNTFGVANDQEEPCTSIKAVVEYSAATEHRFVLQYQLWLQGMLLWF